MKTIDYIGNLGEKFGREILDRRFFVRVLIES